MSEVEVKIEMNAMYDPFIIIELMASNLKKTRNPLGLSNDKINTWWKGLDIPKEGETMLYTGLMYPLIPYIEFMTKKLEGYEKSFMKKFIGLAKYVPKPLFRMLFGKPISKEEKERFDNIVRTIAKLLLKAGVDYFYNPELDIYSGILLYDLGDIDGFIQHAEYVVSRLKEAGVKKVITVDPHTTFALKELYPKYINADLEVQTYFEVLNSANIEATSDASVTIHDPCFYGRYLKLSLIPRELLKKLGVKIVDVKNSMEYTVCCGGPLESLYPTYSKQIAERRVAELKKTGLPIIAMCPICLANLKRGGLVAEDLSEFLAKILLK